MLRSPYKFGAQKQKVWLAPFFPPMAKRVPSKKTAQRESKRADAGVHRTKLGFKEIKRRSIVAGLRAIKAPAVSCSASWVIKPKDWKLVPSAYVKHIHHISFYLLVYVCMFIDLYLSNYTCLIQIPVIGRQQNCMPTFYTC